MPLAQRSSTRTKNINQQMDAVELTIVHPPATNNKPASKHKLIVYESNPEQNTSNSFKSISSVTNGCKRMKIGTSGISETKRAHQDIKVDCSVTQKTKRQKITWPWTYNCKFLFSNKKSITEKKNDAPLFHWLQYQRKSHGKFWAGWNCSNCVDTNCAKANASVDLMALCTKWVNVTIKRRLAKLAPIRRVRRDVGFCLVHVSTLIWCIDSWQWWRFVDYRFL